MFCFIIYVLRINIYAVLKSFMKISNSLLTEIALIGVGTYKTFNDYKNSPKEQKNRTLFRNIVTIGACAAGVFKMDSRGRTRGIIII